jgi:hypothetical protein
MAKVRVFGEAYRFEGVKYTTPQEAVGAALKYLAEHPAVDCAEVERVTEHEPVNFDDMRGLLAENQNRTETVTGRQVIYGVQYYSREASLSRYHPNNGWSVPQHLVIS